jgi:hypothetical protein
VPGKYGLIHDLSFPKGNSVNSLIPPENSTVKYDCINNVVNLVKFFGQDALLSKCDIEDAFRIICLTVEFSGGISEFTEFPFGKDRSCMRPYFPGTDFGD